MNAPALSVLVSAVAFLIGDARAEVPPVQAELEAKYTQAVAQTKDTYQRQLGNLFDRYAEAVERLQNGFQQSGDLESAVLAREEVKMAREDRKTGEEDFPHILPLRQTLSAQAEKIRIAEARELSDLLGKLNQVLEPLKLQFTREGRLESAVELDRRLRELQREMEQLDRLAQPGSPTPRRRTPERVTDSILGQAKPVTGSHRLDPGLYEGIGRTTLGDRQAELADAQKAEIRVVPGSVFRKGEIFLDVARFHAQESLFEQIKFSQNLHSEFRASGCLFDNCTFAKGGAWGARVSSRWVLVDNVFHRNFFTEWRSRLTGVQASHCTFERIDLKPFGYLEDGGAEAVDTWWNLERCLFRDCTVPVSVLLASKNCVLENTRIERDLFPIETRISVTIYYEGIQPEIPEMGDKITIKVLPVEKLGGKVGARINYRLSQEGLEFEN